MPERTVWLIGENNPCQSDPVQGQRYALYPEPAESAGGRLCNLILGMHERDYLRAFERRNLCHERWSVPVARASAACLSWEMAEGDVVLLFGRKVWEAFCPQYDWCAVFPFRGVRWWMSPLGRGPLFIPLPHPSGLNRHWNRYQSYGEVRAAVREIAPHLAPLLGRSPATRGRTAAEREVARVG